MRHSRLPSISANGVTALSLWSVRLAPLVLEPGAKVRRARSGGQLLVDVEALVADLAEHHRQEGAPRGPEALGLGAVVLIASCIRGRAW